jgi:tRNA (adenine57-N1/adenine58-N1)-methyltransferase catalytic subunit
MSKILINKTGKRFFWKSNDLHTNEGMIKEKDIKSSKNKVKTNMNQEFIKFNSSFQDEINNLQRGPAVVIAKDAGSIIANTGINPKSKIVDAGSGSGFLAAYLSNISQNVTTYEKNTKHFNIAKANLKKLNSNAKIKNKDVSEAIDEKNLDLITLDLPEPSKILKHAEKSLKSGAYLVCYLPNITQVQELIKKSKSFNFYLEKTIETIERPWKITKEICRPEHQILGHTAFLVFFRKY